MLFNSLEFLAFLPVVLALALACGRSVGARNGVLLGASYFFYGWWDWRFLSLIVISTVVDFAVGGAMEGAEGPRRKRLLGISVASNLGILGFFKYWNFFSASAREALDSLGLAVPDPVLEVLLPVGISFYTFQTLSYTIDVYRRRIPACRSPLVFAVFVSFFPQLVAGPIERAKHLIPQFMVVRRPTPVDVEVGAWLVLQGFLKKVVIADNLAPIVERVYAPTGAPTAFDVFFGTTAFALQIYGDFSGYSDIARGISRWFGIDLMLNFNGPYHARNIRDFWRRWHISLSTWLRDYLYISLGGNRGTPATTYRNLMITMVLGGLWHGAGWNWVAWGCWHGSLLCAHRLAEPRLAALPFANSSLWRMGAWVTTMSVVLYSWLLFRAADMAHARALTASLFGLREGFTSLLPT